METLVTNRVVSRDDWTRARKFLLSKEKELTRQRDQIIAERRALPWVKIEKEYIFESPTGKLTLSDLFDGRSQLIINHFMLGPEWEEGCIGCSFGADHITGALIHLENHDVSYVAVSRAPISKIEAFRTRMGWQFNWVSSFETDFNFDFHVSFTEEQLANGSGYYNFGFQKIDSDELPGMSVFIKDELGNIYHTYSAYGRGTEELVGTYACLDMTPKGRNENGPNHNLADWVKHHDKYESSPSREAIVEAQSASDSCCHHSN